MIGIKQGMVMQRGADDRCAIFLQSERPLQEAVWEGASHGRAQLTLCEDGTYSLTGIPVGGPYTVTIDGESFTDIYVGDVWILAGQSNMEGVGWLTPEDRTFVPRPTVRALYMTDQWGPANHPLHELWNAVDKVHTEVLSPGDPAHIVVRQVGPGLEFALEMERYTGVPQGVLCCAHGGTCMAQWDPALKGQGGDKSLYGAMLRRVKTNGSHVRGMFWYQGCSDTTPETAVNAFTENMERFIKECREDFGADLPIVQVQISHVVDWADSTTSSPLWSSIREQQRALSDQIPRLLTISTVGKRLDDMIHLSSESQRQVGRQAAEAMYWLLYGTDRNGCLPPPAFRDYRIYPDGVTGSAIIELSYDNLHGILTAPGRPSGFLVGRLPNDPLEIPLVLDIQLRNHTVLVRVTPTPENLSGCCLYYGYGIDPFCNITDQAGREIPAMGPILFP